MAGRLLWAQIARTVYTRRIELELTQAQLAEAARVATRTVRTLESGHVPTRRGPTWPRVEQALGWPVGTIDRWVRQGTVDDPHTEPEPVDPAEAEILDSLRFSDVEKQAMIETLRRHRGSREQQRHREQGGCQEGEDRRHVRDSPGPVTASAG